MQLRDKLLGNAVEHSAENAEIRIELQYVEHGWVEVAAENEGDALPGDKERIFEAFVSSRKQSGNLGLGLFVAQSVARNHGGGIVAEELGGASGACFVVRLPASRTGAALASGQAGTKVECEFGVPDEERAPRN